VAATLRLVLALVAYAVLALLAWRTMAADKIRLVTFGVLGILALRTIIHAARLKREAAEEQKHERETQA
jgi:fatty acid desaturase